MAQDRSAREVHAVDHRPAAEGVPPRLRRARRATAVGFAVHGAVMGTFAARVPWLAAHVGVGVGGLGIALLMPGLGALLSMPASGRLIHRLDLRVAVRLLLLTWCTVLVLPAWPTSLALLCLTLVAFGAAAGLADVAMNAHAVIVEERYGRSVLSGLHGCWSVGVLAGSAASAPVAAADVDARLHFPVVAAVLVLILFTGTRGLLSHRPAPDAVEPPAFALPTRDVLPIGLVGLCAVFAEGAGQDWSAVYLHTRVDASPGTAALAVSVFGLSMAGTRFAGDAVAHRLGPVTTVRVGAVAATTGAVLLLVAPVAAVAVAGFALIGIGVAVVVPLVFAAAGRVGANPGRSIAAVAGIAYGAGLVSPGIIGAVAQVSSLAVAFGVVAVLTVAMGLSAGALGKRRSGA